MGELPYSRGQRTGENAFVGQQDERARTAREIGSRGEVVGRINTQDCVAVYNQVTMVDPSGGAIIVQMPTSVTSHPCRVLIKNASDSVNNITITAKGGETIDGSATLVLAAARRCVTFLNDAYRKEWIRTSRN